MHETNIKLSKEAQDYAERLIKESSDKYSCLKGIVSKSNIKLDDNFEEIKEA